MLTSIQIYSFKCFADLHLSLAPLTLLSGTNSSGKSTVLQALTLLHQTMHDHEWSTDLLLNGSVLELGTVADVVDQRHGTDSFRISLEEDAEEVNTYSWRFRGERKIGRAHV